MRLWWSALGVGVVACLLSAGTQVGAAPSAAASGPSASSGADGCQRVVFTGDGGYYSAGQFHPEPGDDVTIVTTWCDAADAITSYSVRDTTTIPSSAHPYIVKTVKLVDEGRVLRVAINGSYSSGVLNNGGVIALSGYATALGRHHFIDVSGDEG